MSGPIYKPVNEKKREIRILILRPARRSNSRLKCELIHVDLDKLEDAPFGYYEAVSYTWGDATDRLRIELNGHDFTITRNLHGLLKRLRAKKTRGYYWVDAICIDQENIPERGQQVQMMKAIYESAEQVLVWLGPSSDDSDLAMDLMDEITDADEVDQALKDDADAQMERAVAQLRDSLADRKNARKWQALAKLFNRPWWKRVWIRQEVAVASRIMVLCGDDRLHHWSTLISAVEYVNRVAALFEPFIQSIGGQSSGYLDAITLDTLQEQIRDEGSVDEESLFLHGRNCEATDFRDRIFGMVGLADQETREAIVPNYELSGREVFVMATKHLLIRSKSLESLSASQGCLSESDYPSWVIDFAADWSQTPLRYKTGQENMYHASGAISAEADFLTQGTSEVLRVKGIIIGSVDTTSLGYEEEKDEVFRKHVTTASRLELLERWWKAAYALNPNSQVWDLLKPWLRTVLVDQDNNGDRASDDYIDEAYINKGWDHPITRNNLDSIDKMCSDFCASVPLNGSHMLNRHMLLTDSKLLGLGPRGLARDDVVCVLYGCGVPMMLRPTSNDNFLVVGECYIHGMMDGESIEDRDSYVERIFDIV